MGSIKVRTKSYFPAEYPGQIDEMEQQDGGHYVCCLCPEKALVWSDLCIFSDPVMTLRRVFSSPHLSPLGANLNDLLFQK